MISIKVCEVQFLPETISWVCPLPHPPESFGPWSKHVDLHVLYMIASSSSSPSSIFHPSSFAVAVLKSKLEDQLAHFTPNWQLLCTEEQRNGWWYKIKEKSGPNHFERGLFFPCAKGVHVFSWVGLSPLSHLSLLCSCGKEHMVRALSLSLSWIVDWAQLWGIFPWE